MSRASRVKIMVKKKRKTSYLLAVMLNTVSLLLPIGAFLYTLDAPAPLMANKKGLIIFGITLLQYLLFRIPLKMMLEKAIQDNEYDEFGRNKNKTLFASISYSEIKKLLF